MELGRFLVEAVVIGGSHSPSELARSHPISRSLGFEGGSIHTARVRPLRQ